MLNMVKVEIVFADMFSFFKKGMRGGVSYISKRYVKPTISIQNVVTQNKNQNIIYVDMNNLCGFVMSKFLLTSGFKWIDPKDFDSIKYSSNSSKGCKF